MDTQENFILKSSIDRSTFSIKIFKMVIKEFSISSLKGFDKYRLSYPLNPEDGGELCKNFPNTPLISVTPDLIPVTGHDILEWARIRGKTQISCIVVEEKGESIIDSFFYKYRLFKLNPFEKMVFLKKAINHFTPDEIVKLCKPDFRITESLIDSLEFLTSKPVGELLISGKLSLKNGIKLHKDFDSKDQITLISKFCEFNLSHSNQQKVLEIAEELVFRDKKSLSDIDSIFRSGVSDNKPDSGGFWKTLYSLRYPQYTKTENEWKDFVKSLRLPPSIKISHPEHFESKKFTVEITAKDREDAIKILEKLKND